MEGWGGNKGRNKEEILRERKEWDNAMMCERERNRLKSFLNPVKGGNRQGGGGRHTG